MNDCRRNSTVSLATLSNAPGRLAAKCVGNARFIDPDLAAIASREGQAAAWSAAFLRFGVAAPAQAQGDFAVAARDETGRVFLAVDRFAIRSLCFRHDASRFAFAERADELCDERPALDMQAIFDYLYFHVIPAPRTIFEGVKRLSAGHCALFENGKLTVAPWWTPEFVENGSTSFEELRHEFRHLLRASVAAQLDGERVGCFLSGGTDSSTVTGMLREVTGEPPATFSIGFDAEGYDEMEFARITARRFQADHHEYYVTPDDLVRSIGDVAAYYDQPFGNSSVVPAFYCARMARDAGTTKMLAGDGGDELFGGNTRYAKQRIFGAYECIPRSLRASVIEPCLLGATVVARVPGIRKAVSYVEQARVPMPDRLQMYNLTMRLGPGEILTPEFLRVADCDEPLRQQRTVYSRSPASSPLNRILAYDWKYTLADNDLPKVTGATALAGIGVGFPLLDDRLVDFSLNLAPDLKIKGLRLRWFFKESLRGFLPDETIAKRKHGFGLPFGVWAVRHAALRDLVTDAFDSLRTRGIVRPAFLDRLVDDLLPQAPGYYGEMVWILVMLEHWLRAHAPQARIS